MAQGTRKAKITPEMKEEAQRLRKLWDERSHPGQAEFGEKYGIGNQSAVGQFLRGETPISLKAARGFAQGLGCTIEEFSPRLAQEAAALANLAPAGSLSPQVASLATAIDALTPKGRKWFLETVDEILSVARQMNGSQRLNTDDTAGNEIASPKRASG